MHVSRYTTLSISQIENDFQTSRDKGLSSEIVKKIRAADKSNKIAISEIKWWALLIRQVKSAFVYLLIGASVVSFILGERIDAILIISFVAIDVGLSFYQEYKSEKTLRYLKKYIVHKANVIRDGVESRVEVAELVHGDLIYVETGDIIPADIRIIKDDNITIDESTLTGESLTVQKSSEALTTEVTAAYKAKNIAFSGTTVVDGKAYGVVIALNDETEFGKIAKLTVQTQEVSSFEKQINKLSKFILILTITTMVIVVITHLGFKKTVSPTELIIFAVALSVGVIPEAMPLVTTFSLSNAAAKLAKKNVVVKRLNAIEDMGGIQILCTDKTGTITENELTVSDIYSKNPDETLYFGLVASVQAFKEKTTNNSFDLALYNKATKELRERTAKTQRLYEIPFNPSRRTNSVLISVGNINTIILRGAAETVLKSVTNIEKSEVINIVKWVASQGALGKRVFAIATKNITKNTYQPADEESGMSLVGLISFIDPIKESTIPAIHKAHRLGIAIKMITGDSAEVAGAVAYASGIAKDTQDVLTGDELEKMSTSQKYKALEAINVFARISPEMKYQIIELLQKKFEVGYLGDGINDAPALKAAGVAIAVNTAADVSKEVADIVLLKNDLKVIIDGIEEGRKTFVNVTNYIKITLASNFGNFYAMAFATMVIDFLPMLPIQILLVNLLSDFPMIAIATDNVDHSEIKTPKAYDVKEIILLSTILGLVSTFFDFLMFAIFKSGSSAHLQTNWFIGSILTELLLIYSVRTKLSIFKTKVLPSKQILILTITAGIATVFIPLTAFGAKVFSFVAPTSLTLGLIFLIVLGYLASTETVKHMYYKYIGHPQL